MRMKRYLFILRKPPHSGSHVQEMLDIILTAAAFDQSISLLLLDDGVFQLKKSQQPEVLAMKDTAAIFEALELYEITQVYVELESLQERGLKPADLALQVMPIHRHMVAGLMKQFDVIFPG
jgi:tRNA 2-thiouridine synthesizing protein C